MIIAKIFQNGASQAIRLPKDLRFEGNEVLIEKRGEALVLKPLAVPKFQSFAEIGAFLAETFPSDEEFPEPAPRPSHHGPGFPER